MEAHGKLVEVQNPYRWWDICIISDEEVYYRVRGGEEGDTWSEAGGKIDFFSWLIENGNRYNYIEYATFEGNV